ncbi:hypothetical protein [Sphingosinicella terrae]|uniref:hypothetical protein n=1 Tax=Sphingosinicella terrae TaxID=2172047 RepID=UPI0013B3C185|nr:hypothetical protein [Sphingosinicella terrae]
MRILFYLPVVTPWWFDHIVARLIERVAREAEVHVMVPPLWQGTGIGPDQLLGVDGSDRIAWHILDGEGHERLRTCAAGFDALFDLVAEIDADITFCRSADVESPRRFPGTVRYLMEGAFPPFPSRDEWIVLREQPFDHGAMPPIGAEAETALVRAIEPAWHRTRQLFGQEDRASRLHRLGLPADRLVLALPLEYEHEENFFGIHRSHADNAALVAELADSLDANAVLAVTDHPLNRLYCDRSALHETIARRGGAVRLIEGEGEPKQATLDLVAACDGLVVGNSKAITIGGFLGKPILRLSDHASGAWLNAGTDLAAFTVGLRSGSAPTPSASGAQAWFAFHAANSVIDPADADLDAGSLFERVEKPVDPRRWHASLLRYAQTYPELFQ